MELSIFLAKVMGLYLLIACAAVFLNRRIYSELLGEFARNRAAVLSSGALILILGLAVVISHNVWTSDWRVIVTLIGWATALKGALRMLFPNWVTFMASKMTPVRIMIPAAVFWIVGLYLSYVGFLA